MDNITNENMETLEIPKTKNQLYYEKHKEKMKQYMRNYRLNNNDKIKEYQKEYYKNNKNKYECDICNVFFVSKQDHRKHLITKKHFKLMKLKHPAEE
jgi:hypothetical protein